MSNFPNAIVRDNWEKHGERPSVKDYGAKGDAQRLGDGAVNVSTPTVFTSALATFSLADQGKAIVVLGAGAGGATLLSTVSVYVDPHTITLGIPALTTVSAATFIYGTDDTAAFQLGVDSLSDGRQWELEVPKAAGSYLTAAPVNVGTRKLTIRLGGATWYAASTLVSVAGNVPAFPPQYDGGCVCIEGCGPGSSKISYLLKSGSLIAQTQINGAKFYNLTFEALAAGNTATCLNLTTHYNLRLSDVHILNFDVGVNLNGTDDASGHGRGSWFYIRDVFIHQFTSAGLMSSHSVELMLVNLNCYAVVNNPTAAWGLILDTDTSGINVKNVILSFCGMIVRNTMGNVGSPFGIPPEFIYGDNLVADSMPSHGIHFDASLAADGLGRAGKSYHFVNSWASFSTAAGKDGVLIEAGQDISFTDLRARVNRQHGVHIKGTATHVRLVNACCLGNNFQNVANGAGIYIEGASAGRVTVIGGLCGDNVAGEGSGFQYWGIYVDATYVAPHAIGMGTQFDGNQTGAISDNSPASYQQQFGFMDLTGGQQIHKFFAPKAQWQFGDGAFYLDFNKDFANAVALVFDANTFIRNVRGSHKILLVALTGEVDTTNAPILRTAQIRSQDIVGLNVDAEAGWDLKCNVVKIPTQLRLVFAAGSASTPLKASSTGDVLADKINMASSNEVTGTLPLANGGTSGTDAASARISLSVYSKADIDAMMAAKVSVGSTTGGASAGTAHTHTEN